MLLQAASPLSIPVVVLDSEVGAPAKQVASPGLLPISAKLPAPLAHIDGAFTDEASIRKLAEKVDVLTIEIEHVDVDALERVADEFKATGGRSGNGVAVYPAPSIIRIIQDKFAQKQYLAARGIPVAPFVQIKASAVSSLGENAHEPLVESVLAAGRAFGYPLMLKSRHLAYDGKGNYLLRSGEAAAIQAALEALVPAASIATGRALGERLYAEKFAPFVKEVAVMVVRGVDGKAQAYPAVETIHRDSVCHIVYAPLRPPAGDDSGVGKAQAGLGSIGGKAVDERASEDAQKAIEALGEGAVGVFGVEMFLMADGRLLLNEIAPRPHNSGHYTIEACQPSQFTSHLYAILDIPLPKVKFLPNSAGMLNLLGFSDDADADFTPITRKAIELGASVHLYGKPGCRKGRKMGHITVTGKSDDEVDRDIQQLAALLPGTYATPAPAQDRAPFGPFSAAHPLVSVIMGSDSDLPVMELAADVLTSFGIPFELSIVSAHRTPGRMVQFAREAAGRGVRVVIAGAGGAAHLPGMVASETSLPVIGVPVRGSTLDGVDSLYSIVQMPVSFTAWSNSPRRLYRNTDTQSLCLLLQRGIPVATVAINNATNAALLAVRILAGSIPSLRAQIDAYAANLGTEVMAKVAKIETIGWDEYLVQYKKK